MRIKYDKSTDAAYLYIQENIAPGGVAKTYPCDPLEVDGQINLDFDADGRLLGIEILDASKRLPLTVIRAYGIVPER